MGFFSAIGTALSNPDVQDRLAAIGSALQGDTQSAQAYQQRVAQRQANDATAAQIEAERQRQAQAQSAPSPGYNSNSLPPNGPTQLAPPPAPVSVAQLPQLPPRAAAPADAAPAPASLASVPAPSFAPAMPQASPDASAAPSAPSAPKSLYAAMLPQLLRAAGRGADVSGLASTLQQEDYISSLPQKAQALARAVGASTYGGWQKPVYNETGSGNTWGSFDPTTSQYTPIYTAPNKPHGPLTESEVRGQILQNHKPGTPFTDEEKVALGYKDDQYGTSQALADAYNRVTNPAQYGQPSQTDRDMVQAMIEGKKKGDGFNILTGLAGGGGDSENGNPKPAAPPPGGKNLPQRGSTAASAVAVKTMDEAAALPKGTWFLAPDGVRRQRK